MILRQKPYNGTTQVNKVASFSGFSADSGAEAGLSAIEEVRENEYDS